MSEQSSPAGFYRRGTGQLPPAPPTRRRRLVGLIAALTVILLSLLMLFFLLPRPTATVMLTGVSETRGGLARGSYAPRRVSFRQQGSGSGVPIPPGTGVWGTLTFQNYAPFWVTIPQGIIVTNVPGRGIWRVAQGVATARAHRLR